MSSYDGVIQDLIFGLENIGYILDDFVEGRVEAVDIEDLRREIKGLFKDHDSEVLSQYLNDLVQRS